MENYPHTGLKSSETQNKKNTENAYYSSQHLWTARWLHTGRLISINFATFYTPTVHRFDIWTGWKSTFNNSETCSRFENQSWRTQKRFRGHCFQLRNNQIQGTWTFAIQCWEENLHWMLERSQETLQIFEQQFYLLLRYTHLIATKRVSEPGSGRNSWLGFIFSLAYYYHVPRYFGCFFVLRFARF